MSDNHGIIVLGATNRPFDLDDAILRRMPRRLLSKSIFVILVDLPNENARLSILKTHLKGETIGDSVDLSKLAKGTVNYSGSDLKNICVATALARIKETILLEQVDTTKNQVKMSEIADWGEYLTDSSLETFELPPLSQSHIDIGLAESPPSLSEEMETLVELRKWDAQFGDGAAKRKRKPSMIGFL